MSTPLTDREEFFADDGHSGAVCSDFARRLEESHARLLEALKNIENDDSSIPSTIWEMRCAAIAEAEKIK